MNRREQALFRNLERFAAAEDPALDRTLREGFPSAARRRRGVCFVAAGTLLFFASVLAGTPFGALSGLVLAAFGAFLAYRGEGQAPDLAAIFRAPRPRADR